MISVAPTSNVVLRERGPVGGMSSAVTGSASFGDTCAALFVHDSSLLRTASFELILGQEVGVFLSSSSKEETSEMRSEIGLMCETTGR